MIKVFHKWSDDTGSISVCVEGEPSKGTTQLALDKATEIHQHAPESVEEPVELALHAEG